LKQWAQQEPLESIQRLNGIQALVDECLGVLEGVLFNAVFERLRERAAEVASRCPVCGFASSESEDGSVADDAVRSGGRGLALPMSCLPDQQQPDS